MKHPAKKLSPLLEQGLNAYTLAAAAAGVGALCFAQPAEGKIVYTPANVKISTDRGIFWLDVNHDGIPDFGLMNQYGRFSRFWSATLNVVALARLNAVAAKGRFGGDAAFALRKGAKIGPSAGFQSEYYYPAFMVRGFEDASATNIYGYWQGGTVERTTAYLGLLFEVKGNPHFGWARVKVTPRTPHGYNATLTGYAYETIPNKPIIAGATKGPDDSEPTASLNVPTPEPATLGVLAMGAPGLSIWRRKEPVAATPESN
jgi:hypothetical protein